VGIKATAEINVHRNQVIDKSITIFSFSNFNSINWWKKPRYDSQTI